MNQWHWHWQYYHLKNSRHSTLELSNLACGYYNQQAESPDCLIIFCPHCSYHIQGKQCHSWSVLGKATNEKDTINAIEHSKQLHPQTVKIQEVPSHWEHLCLQQKQQIHSSHKSNEKFLR